MHRFFVEKNNIKKSKVIISGEDYNHIYKSLRLKPGDKIIACPGDGFDYITKLTDFNNEDNYVKGNIVEKTKNSSEPDINISLAQAIPKDRNMELVAEKGTEIGIKYLIPLETERTIVKISGKKKKKRINRWQRIMEAAAKQSQRGIIPTVKDLYKLDDIQDIIYDYDLVVALWTGESDRTLYDIFEEINFDEVVDILILIGPEGGFTETEINKLNFNEHSFCYQANLGSRILRTETAGLVVSSIILYNFNDFI